ncbi:MAG: hypothetical protein ISS25_00260 [Nanoarchaeota archaeon]|nr:hypothetical protein [DPANN group archaeon]MBL7116251.1 hypothetical protein [Nanoarchaeota archaeon]
MHDIVFVGSGPSVLAGAVEVLKRNPKTKLLILEQGASLAERVKKKIELQKAGKINEFDVMIGAGGAGTFSDGKFHFTQALSHYYTKSLLPEEEKKYYDLYLNLAEKYCLEIGNLNVDYTPKDPKSLIPIIGLFKKHEVNLFLRRARHVGTEELPKFVNGFINEITARNGIFRFNSEVVDLIVEAGICKGVVLKSGESISAKKVVLGVGRSGATRLIPKLIEKYNIPNTPRDLLLGGRVAFPKEIGMDYADLMYEFIFSVKTSSGHYLRSFCPCMKGGSIAVENYYDEKLGRYSCVNGASSKNYKTKVGNFAFLRITPPKDIEDDVFEYSKNLAANTFRLGNNKPIVQKISDLVNGEKTTTLEGLPQEIIDNLNFDYSLGSVEEAYGKEVIEDFKEGFLKLNHKSIMKGIVEKGIIVWPEIKFGRNLIIETDKTEILNIKNLYAIGDGAGNSGNIVGAMIAGLICAHKITSTNIKDLYRKKIEKVLVIKNYELDIDNLDESFEILN